MKRGMVGAIWLGIGVMTWLLFEVVSKLRAMTSGWVSYVATFLIIVLFFFAAGYLASFVYKPQIKG